MSRVWRRNGFSTMQPDSSSPPWVAHRMDGSKADGSNLTVLMGVFVFSLLRLKTDAWLVSAPLPPQFISTFIPSFLPVSSLLFLFHFQKNDPACEAKVTDSIRCLAKNQVRASKWHCCHLSRYWKKKNRLHWWLICSTSPEWSWKSGVQASFRRGHPPFTLQRCSA